MLPVFPRARKAMQDTFFHGIFEAMWNASPLLRQIRVRAQVEGREASFEQEGGKTVNLKYEALRVIRSLKFEDACGLDPEAFIEIAEGIGTEMGRAMLRSVLEDVRIAATEVGNTLTCEGNGISFDQFLELTAKLRTEFDEEGNPRGKTLVLSPEAFNQMSEAMKEWEADSAKRAAMEAVVQKKARRIP